MSILIRGQFVLTVITCLYSSLLHATVDIDVFIRGLDKPLEQNVRLFLSIYQQKDYDLLDTGRMQRLHQKATNEISRALQPFGYYRPQVEATLVQSSSGQWNATYTIDKGPAITIQQFSLQVNPEVQADTAFSEYLNNLPLSEGDILIHQDYEAIKTSLLQLANERGFFDAQIVEHRVEVDLESYQAMVKLRFEGGQRYVFGEIDVSGNVLDPTLLQNYIDLEQGSDYQLVKVINLQQVLTDSDYFHTVEVSPGQPDPTLHQIPIELKLTPRKKNRYSLGLGYGTDTGARMSLGWGKPLINSKGHQFNSELKVSEIGNSLSAQYSLPVLNPRTDRLVYSAAVVNEKTDTSDSRVQSLGISLNHLRKQWRETLSLEYQQEKFTVAETSDESTLLLPGIRWSRIWGRELVNTRQGFRVNISLRAAARELLSDVDFFQLRTGAKLIWSAGDLNRFILRGTIGSSWINEFEVLPSSVRFFTGGADSVRGYRYKSLGPEDDNGDVEGGKHLLIASIEFDHSFNDHWGAALFSDMGNAINNFNDELENGTGFGLRWKSPVGAVRIDLASAISQPGNPWRLHINIGPDL